MISFLITLLGSLICFTAMTFAGDISSQSSEFLLSDKQHCRTSIRHIEGGGIGYNHGYTTLEGFFAPDPKSWDLMPFLDLRGHVFDDGKVAANAGIGLRKIMGCKAYGLNAYYDYRNTKKINYNQVGFGLEALGKRCDFRINGYLPVGKKITSPYHSKFTGFVDYSMIISQKYQFATNGGANAELGFHFGKTRLFDFYAATGAYYFSEKIGPQIWGGKGRLVARFKEYVTVELSNSYDKVFHNRFQGQLTFTLPFGGSHVKQKDPYNSCDTTDVLFSRMIQPVKREEIIVSHHRNKCSAAIDPTTGRPLHFVFVDNTSHSNGTYESPFPTLALAQENSGINDIIYVFPGDGTTKGMDAGIILQHNQKFWGSGTNHSIQASQGNIIIPAQSSFAPKMTNIAGDGITLASVNQVSGFTLTNVIGNGIIGTTAENIEISECTIDRSQFDQIHLEYNRSSGTATLNNLILTNGAINGIFIDAATASMDCSVNGCTIQDNTVFAIDASCAKQAIFKLMNNKFEHNGSLGGGGGTTFINFNGPSTLLISGNTFNNNRSVDLAPLLIKAGTTPLSATIENNTINENVCGAIHFVLNDTDSAQLNVSNNTVTNNGSGSIASFGSALLINPNGSTTGNCRLNLTDNTFLDNNASCLYCANGAFNDFQVNATGNTLTGNGGGGFVFANGCNTFALNATNNIISNGHDHGITTGGGITIASADITISRNQITGNTNFANGIALSHAGSNLNFIATNNNISENDTSGIIMYSSDVIENVVVNIENNTINNNQNLGSNAVGGVDLEQYTNLSGSIANNTLANNIGAGLFVGSTEPSPSVCLNMNGNNSNTGYTLSSGTGIFNLAPCDVNSINTGTITPIGTITAVQSCPDAISCP
ncbi:MAG: right-handed parallel beta-helix repeat-containing protein [Gammaproteobacteria bacterium]|nr:right-handed parallel beta-helix repeat-containing protein [Gammaproteobacteria bacterium]